MAALGVVFCTLLTVTSVAATPATRHQTHLISDTADRPLPSHPRALSLTSGVHDYVPTGKHRAHGAHHTTPSPQLDASGADDHSGLLLLALSAVATAGTMGSIFVVSAITVIDTFQVRGNAYLASFALGHLLVTVFGEYPSTSCRACD